MKKILIFFLLISVILLSSFTSKEDASRIVNVNDALIKDDPSINLTASTKSYVVLEASTNKVLYEYKKDQTRFPASMTKIATMYLVIQKIKDGTIKYDDIVTVSEYAASMGGTQVFLAPKEQISVKDLLYSMVIASANDASVALAEYTYGSEKKFVDEMNRFAQSLRCTNTHFSNCTGLPTKDHYTTCYDLGIMACKLLDDYEEDIIPITSTYESYIRSNTSSPFWLVNTNKLVKRTSYIDGLKTGWTNEAGYCLTATTKQNGMRLVTVLMASDNPDNRNKDALKLLDLAYSQFEKVTLKYKNDVIKEMSSIKQKPSKYRITLLDDLVFIKHKEDVIDDIKYVVDIDENKLKNIDEQIVGNIKAYLNDELIANEELVKETKVFKASFIEIYLKVLKSLF